MSNLGVQIDVVTDFDGAMGMIQGMESAFSPEGQALILEGAIQPYLQEEAAKRFASEGDEAVGKWLELTEGTQAIRSNQGFPPEHPINQRTGDLKDFITQTDGSIFISAQGAALQMPGDPPDSDTWDAFITAQQGGDSGMGRPTPPRPVLALTPTDLIYFQTQLMAALFRHSEFAGVNFTYVDAEE